MDATAKKYFGLLLGAMTGDCLGLPFEMLSPAKKIKIYGPQISHKFLSIPFQGQFGLCSDDTEHAWLTALALYNTKEAALQNFGDELAANLKRWLFTFPIGIGRATLLSGLKLIIGKKYSQSGIHSAGNGAAIRALVIGAFYADDLETMLEAIQPQPGQSVGNSPQLRRSNTPVGAMLEAVNASTMITHTDKKAYEGSAAIALAAATAMKSDLAQPPTHLLFDTLLPLTTGQELKQYLSSAQSHLAAGSSLADYLKSVSIPASGVSGYINHTVPAVIYAWLRYYGDYRETISQLISAGGDTDSTAALAGALSGLTVGAEGIPEDWLNGACGWPLKINHFREISQALSTNGAEPRDVPSNFLFFIRNILSLPIFGFHILRRILGV